ncbi:aminotransferase class I/II-fold pyridoxal phosphate-dependent enzyme [Limosilactobacillus kribbianus]|uniref:aminotransferase class I/II-fold pyridoxal phosphate-dependent enzyme n=1 Tax=Limosilactobacillus kribbianus TaxID=2982695 RepID=UPI00226481E9|nr:aminotransferase class I/II-fold pyridoxal phosphate-dependent enzyme [Limosilactobacillus kribbianus]
MPTTKPAIMKNINKNFARLKPVGIRAFDYKASTIPGIVKLTLGEPDFNVPEPMKEAAIKSIEDNDSHYAPGNGTVELRKAIAHFMKDRYDLDYDPDSEIAVTIGATEGIYASLATVTNPGDDVLVATPTFPLYSAITTPLGSNAIEIDTSADDFVLTPERLKQALADHPAAKALVLNYPSNPTGVTYTRDQVKALADTVKDTDLVVIADEIYSELVYDGTHTSIAEFIPDQTLVLNGASKSHAMTGYRIGFIAGPKELMGPVSATHAMMVTAASDPAMAAATAAFATEAGKEATFKMKAAYKERRDFLVDALRKLGFTITTPNGAFYVFAKLPEKFGKDDIKFATDLANEGKVAVIPGSYFGAGGQGHLRISYATSLDNIKTAVERIKNFVEA